MKLIIAGGRDNFLTDIDKEFLGTIKHLITEVVSGEARGIDKSGEAWAEENNIPVKKFPADWDRLGKRVGHVRNQQMAEYADGVALFAGGRGTDNMFKCAKKEGITVYDRRYL